MPGRLHNGRSAGTVAWHALAPEAALRGLESSARGLVTAEVQRRRARLGANAVADPVRRTRLQILLGQVANLPSGLLLGSTAGSALAGDRLDAAAILSAVGLNAAIGYRVERKNEDLLASWRQLEAGRVQVVRGGALRAVPAPELVPGDVILCRAGDTVPADARLLEAHRLSCDESALTGESEPQAKSVAAVARRCPLAQRTSMLHAATIAATGHGRAVVVATGSATEAAQVRTLLEREEAPRTPLQRQLDALGRSLAAAGVGAGAVTGLAGLLHGRRPLAALRNAVALTVAAIPEGLPMVSTAALVRSMQRMRTRGMVVRRLASAETLGRVTVVCADKTGTLTENDMRLEVLEIGGDTVDPAAVRAMPGRVLDDLPTLALAAAVLNSDLDVQRAARGTAVAGSSTERALLRAAEAAGLDRDALRAAYPRRLLRERDEQAKYVVSVHDVPGGAVAFVKGAPEQVLGLCVRDARGAPLTPRERRRVLARNDQLADTGLRVLALGWRPMPAGRGPRTARRRVDGGGYTFIGLAALRDPLRSGAADAIRDAARAGVRTVIITGDQRRTAVAVARQVGLEGETVDGSELAAVLAAARRGRGDRLRRVAVFSRVTAADKVAIVRALRSSGEIVAMAGDGINDAPALKAADVGIAIGIRSSDLARQAADVVLENEDLRSILSAVGEGRVVQDNLRRAVRYLLTTNLAEAALVTGAAVLGRADPFTPLQLLWINLLSDTLPALALALEPASDDVLARPPARPDAALLDAPTRAAVARDGTALAALGTAALLVGGQPLLFSLLGGAELGYALRCRAPGAAPSGSFLRLLGSGAALHLGALTLPPLRVVLGLPPIVSALELGGFCAGLIIPPYAAWGGPDELIVRRGRAAPAARGSVRRSPSNRAAAARLTGGAALEVSS